MSAIPARHGVFLPPFHPMNENSAACIERDLELMGYLDQLARVIHRGGGAAHQMHIAETRAQAMKNVKYGFDPYLDYLNNNQPRFIVPPGKDAAEWFVESKYGVIGTPDDAITLIQRLYDKQGQFGAVLQQVHDWVDFKQTKRSYELYQRYVMPHFSGANGPRAESFDWCSENRALLTEKRVSAARAMFDKHEAEQRAKDEMARPVRGKEAW